MTPMRLLLHRYVWPHRYRFFIGSLCLSLTNLLTVSIPIEIGLAIDNIGQMGAGRHILNIALMGLCIVVVRTLSRVLFFNPARDIEYHIRTDLLERLLLLQPAFYATHKRGDIISRASNDITWARVMIGFGGLQLVNVFMALGLAGWKMIAISPRLSILGMAPVAFGFIIVQAVIRRLYPIMKRNQEEMASISEHVLDSFQSVATISGFRAQDAFSLRFKARNQAWFKTGMKLALLRALFSPLIALCGGFSVVVILWVGAPMVAAKTLTVGDLAALIALIAALIPYMRSIGWMFSVWQRGRAAIERIFELIMAPVERPEGDSPVPMTSGKGPSIEVSDLSFAYPDQPDVDVLKKLNFSIPAGATVGVFGRTGSGKSTLLQLLTRVYNPRPGQVSIDGIDSVKTDIFEWRKRISYTPQRPFLFSDTIRSNIEMSRSPDPEKLKRAIDMASMAQDLPSLDNGLETVVGERGIMLSGGQRQRVALARGLYRGGDLILLDDVLSAVDHENEMRLLDTLKELSRGQSQKTCIIVSNRISAFRYSDFILVLENGELIDSGDHASLIERTGPYQDAYLAQKQNLEESA